MSDDQDVADFNEPADSTEIAAPTGELTVFGRSAVEMRTELATQRADSARMRLALERKAADAKALMEEERSRIMADFDRRNQELMAQMEPLRAELAKVEEMVWTIDLYLGRDEEIELLRDGEPAPVDTPITIRQMVRSMDEESIALIDQGGVDAQSVEVFFEWLLADPANLDRVMPERKSVVVLRPTRNQKDYGSPWLNAAMEEANEASHWLIRNGERLYRLTTNIVVGDRLVPAQSEFVDFFYTREYARHGDPVDATKRDRVPMEPGSDAWLKAEAAADKRQRHYMRLMLILSGLVDRTVVFHPLPEGGVNFMSVEAQERGKVVIINELDNVLTSGRPSFREWQKDLNSKLRPGIRIIGDFGREFGDENLLDDRRHWGKHSRLTPDGASRPESLVPHLIEGRADGGGFFIRYQRTDTIYRQGRYDDRGRWVEGREVTPEIRARCVIKARDTFILPFDLVSVEEMEVYLNASTERHAYLTMVPVLRAAIAAKKAEAAAEEPFRLLLAGVIFAKHGGDLTEIEATLPEMVETWKVANRWARPLVSATPAEEAKAIAAISKDWAARQKAKSGSGSTDAAAIAAGKLIDDVVMIGRRRDGKYVAYAASEPGQNTWLDEYRLDRKRGFVSTKRWTIPVGRTIAATTVLHAEESWATWNLNASRFEHLTGPERAAFVEEHLFPYATGPAIALTHETSTNSNCTGAFVLYCWTNPDGPTESEIESAVKVEGMLQSITARWKRTQGGTVTAVGYEGRYDYKTHKFGPDSDHYRVDCHQFERVTHEGSKGLPGLRPEDLASYKAEYTSGWRGPILVWNDPTQLDLATATRREIGKRLAAGRAVRNVQYGRARAVTEAVEAIYNARIEASLHARFVEDFGTDDAELWANHRKTIKPKQVRTSNDVDLAVAEVMSTGHDLTGMTLTEVVALSTPDRWDRRPTVPEELADIAIPAIEFDEPDDDDELGED